MTPCEVKSLSHKTCSKCYSWVENCKCEQQCECPSQDLHQQLTQMVLLMMTILGVSLVFGMADVASCRVCVKTSLPKECVTFQ